jgi:hypothetical protein
MIDFSDYSIQFAKQTGRGVYPADPTYKGWLIGPGLTGKPEIGQINVGDANPWTPSIKRVKGQQAGGEITLLVQPNDVGLLIYSVTGAKAVAGGGDPYTHTFTPYTDSSSCPYITFWQYTDGRWELFRDCQVVKMELTVANDASDGFMLLKITVVGMARKKKVAAPASPATAETDVYHWLDAAGYWCLSGDFANIDHTAVATNQATAETKANALKAAYNLHCAVASGRHHQAADAVNTITAVDATDLASLLTLLIEIKTDLTAHMADETVHYFADVTNAVSHANPTDLPTALTFLQEVGGADENTPGDYNGHLGLRAGTKSFTLVLDGNASTINGEGMTAYAVQRKRGTVTLAAEILAEDWREHDLVHYGDPAVADGTEATDEIQVGGFDVKWIASTSGAERSIQVTMPQFDYDPNGFDSMDEGDPEGGEKYMTVGGDASGSAPLVTITVLNGVASY